MSEDKDSVNNPFTAILVDEEPPSPPPLSDELIPLADLPKMTMRLKYDE